MSTAAAPLSSPMGTQHGVSPPSSQSTPGTEAQGRWGDYGGHGLWALSAGVLLQVLTALPRSSLPRGP